jgi:hypothetical protein
MARSRSGSGSSAARSQVRLQWRSAGLVLCRDVSLAIHFIYDEAWEQEKLLHTVQGTSSCLLREGKKLRNDILILKTIESSRIADKF